MTIMRLVDQIAAVRGDEYLDFNGIMTQTHAAIMQAQRFELRDDVALAAHQLIDGRPSTLLKAMPLTRLPYPKMWVEWRGGLTGKLQTRKNAPTPAKIGALLEAQNGSKEQLMTIALAWTHDISPEGERGIFPNVCPFNIVFDNRETPDVLGFIDQDIDKLMARVTAQMSYSRISFLEFVRFFLDHLRKRAVGNLRDLQASELEGAHFKRWDLRKATEREAMNQLLRRTVCWICPHAWPMLVKTLHTVIREPDAVFDLMKGWENDIAGEAPFIECVLAMINSRNAVEHRPVDLSKVNKSRRKRRQPEFAPYSITQLAVSRGQRNVGRHHGMSVEAVRQHLVLGHFKIRRTGVFWWSPFLRGDSSRPIQRQQYDVHL